MKKKYINIVQNSDRVDLLTSCKMTHNFGASVTFALKFRHCVEAIFLHCQKFGTRWRLRLRTKVMMTAKSYKEMYGNKETFSNTSIMSLWVFGATRNMLSTV